MKVSGGQNAQDALALARKVGRRIKKNRVEAGLTQCALANAARVSRPNMTRLERGDHVPSLGLLLRVAVALNVDIASFFQDDA